MKGKGAHLVCAVGGLAKVAGHDVALLLVGGPGPQAPLVGHLLPGLFCAINRAVADAAVAGLAARSPGTNLCTPRAS